MNQANPPADDPRPAGRPGQAAGRVLLVTSVMLAFLSYRRTAAVVLCDLASTAYYIGGIVEAQIGRAAPWFILAVMLFSYAVRSVYIESCSMFTRGGVYRIVKEAVGGLAAKLSVSALLFDYVLTGPISGVSAGQYFLGLTNELLALTGVHFTIPESWGSVAIAAAITAYFWHANVRGLRESTDKALKIMAATTVMAVVMIAWCGITLAVRPEARRLPSATPVLSKQVDKQGKPILNEITGRQEDPLGWLGGHEGRRATSRPLRVHWFSLIGALGILVAFGHSVLAMSGEETLAQVYREVEAPKLANFKKAAFVVFLYSLLLTGLISFFAVMIIPDELRVGPYKDNLIGGLAMSVAGPKWARLILHGVVVVVGSLILSGAVNTAIVGSNGVLNRVAEDGVLPEWFLQPHPKHGTTSRILNLIFGLQLFTIVVSRGDVILLGEAYAFGVVWSFVFMAMAMLVLRFRRPGGRKFLVPGNVRVGRYDVPVGLAGIFLVLLAAASVNLLTKQVATVAGGVFAATLFAILVGLERFQGKRSEAGGGPSREEFQAEEVDALDPQALGLVKPDRVVVGIRPEASLEALRKCLDEVDPKKTEVVVVVADVETRQTKTRESGLSETDRALLTRVVTLAEDVGKPVRPLIVPTDHPPEALARVARAIGARELVVGGSGRAGTDAQFEEIAGAWRAVADGASSGLEARILGEGRDDRRKLGPDRQG